MQNNYPPVSGDKASVSGRPAVCLTLQSPFAGMTGRVSLDIMYDVSSTVENNDNSEMDTTMPSSSISSRLEESEHSSQTENFT